LTRLNDYSGSAGGTVLNLANGYTFHLGLFSPTFEIRGKSGDRGGVLVNLRAGTVSFYHNGVFLGTPIHNLEGKWYPIMGANGCGDAAQLDLVESKFPRKFNKKNRKKKVELSKDEILTEKQN